MKAVVGDVDNECERETEGDGHLLSFVCCGVVVVWFDRDITFFLSFFFLFVEVVLKKSRFHGLLE